MIMETIFRLIISCVYSYIMHVQYKAFRWMSWYRPRPSANSFCVHVKNSGHTYWCHVTDGNLAVVAVCRTYSQAHVSVSVLAQHLQFFMDQQQSFAHVTGATNNKYGGQVTFQRSNRSLAAGAACCN